jgi:hypothetical protein
MTHADLASDKPAALEAGHGADPRREQLIGRWLQAYGVVDALELDLGTLASIGEQVRDGVGPGDRF